MTALFSTFEQAPAAWVADELEARHYLGATRRGWAWRDEFGILVFAAPTSRRLPSDRWRELTRWCLSGEPNAGSRQWRRVAEYLTRRMPDITTVVSYSDPSVGHTGALYRACNWLWAPTWHRLRTPPTGNGRWTDDGKAESVKDRWVFVLAPDAERERLLAVDDESLARRYPWASYREPKFRRGVPVGGTGGGDYKRWRTLAAEQQEQVI